jgi:hypothetical protein
LTEAGKIEYKNTVLHISRPPEEGEDSNDDEDSICSSENVITFIEVRGIPDQLMKDDEARLFFESKRHSGGGEIESLALDKSRRAAINQIQGFTR